MKISMLAVAFGLLVSGAAFAQNAPATPTATPPAATAPKPAAAPAAAPKADAAAKAAKSAECSKEAEAKGLHGKERKKFREECKKGK
jgi:hypothetical protein